MTTDSAKLSEQATPAPDAIACKSALGAIQDALYVLNGKWKIPVLVAILEGNVYFGDIQRAGSNIAKGIVS